MTPVTVLLGRRVAIPKASKSIRSLTLGRGHRRFALVHRRKHHGSRLRHSYLVLFGRGFSPLSLPLLGEEHWWRKVQIYCLSSSPRFVQPDFWARL